MSLYQYSSLIGQFEIECWQFLHMHCLVTCKAQSVPLHMGLRHTHDISYEAPSLFSHALKRSGSLGTTLIGDYCSCVHSFRWSRLVGLVCTVYTMSYQLQLLNVHMHSSGYCSAVQFLKYKTQLELSRAHTPRAPCIM